MTERTALIVGEGGALGAKLREALLARGVAVISLTTEKETGAERPAYSAFHGEALDPHVLEAMARRQPLEVVYYLMEGPGAKSGAMEVARLAAKFHIGRVVSSEEERATLEGYRPSYGEGAFETVTFVSHGSDTEELASAMAEAAVPVVEAPEK